VGKLAVLSWLAGTALVGGIDGDTVAGVGQVLIGLAAVIAALAGLRNGQRIRDVSVKAKAASEKAETAAVHASDAASNSATAVRTLGPENGKTLREILDQQTAVLSEVRDFEQYQHGRNHAVLGELAVLKATTPTLLRAVEMLIARLDETENP
jgi:hypothetical protein